MLRPVNLLQCTQVWVIRSTHSCTDGIQMRQWVDYEQEHNNQQKIAGTSELDHASFQALNICFYTKTIACVTRQQQNVECM